MEVKSSNSKLNSLVENWLSWDNPNSESFRYVGDLVRGEKWSELENIMMKRLKFGTAGIRGPMGPGFSNMNDLIIIQTSQGLAQYVLSCFKTPEEAQKAGAVISFDARHNSCRWAKLTARAFMKAGFKVYLFNQITPTPFVPFTVQQLKAAVGVMITASHNPKEDNGYKVFWSNGPQIKPPHDKNILKNIGENLEPVDHQAAFNENLNEFQVEDPTEKMSNCYYETLQNLLYDRENLNANFAQKIVYSAMHGVGASFIDRAFSSANFPPVVHVEDQKEPNPDFPTVPFPNPEEGKSALNLSMKLADEIGAIYILANDPDADRLAIAEKVDGVWKIFNGNEIGTLLAWWQLQVHLKRYGEQKYQRKNLYFIASTVSSKMLGSLAKKEGLTFLETLTGFKWMANKAYDLEEADPGNKVLLGYEEAIGFMCGTQVLDKDGVSAAVRAAELMAFLDLKKLTLSGKLNEIYDEYGYHCNRTSYFFVSDKSITQRIFDRLRKFDDGKLNSYPETLAGKYKVVSVRDLTTGYDSSTADNKAEFPIDPNSQMITFKFDNGVIATLRTSGTEPKLKYYAEYCGKPDQKDWIKIEKELDELVLDLSQDFVQAEVHGLAPRSG